MKFTTQIAHEPLICVLRALMKPDMGSVIGRDWVYRDLCFVYISYNMHAADVEPLLGVDFDIVDMFPELANVPGPYRIKGERIVERAALVHDFEETTLIRYVGSTDNTDMEIYIDTESISITTDSEIDFDVLTAHFASKGYFG